MVSVLEVINSQTVLRSDYMTFGAMVWMIFGLFIMICVVERLNLYDRIPLIGGSR